MSDNKFPPPAAAAGYPEGYPPPGYPTKDPQPQYAEVPIKTQMRREKGYIEGLITALCCCFLCGEGCCPSS